MPEFIRVTDEVKPRREYSIPEAAFIEGVHTVVKDKEGAMPDGTPLPPKYTPQELAANNQTEPYAKWRKADLEREVATRNEGREGDLIAVGGTGKIADLAEALDADDAGQADAPGTPPTPESLAGNSGHPATTEKTES